MVRRVKEEMGEKNRVLSWAFPGGRPEEGESRGQCVKREVLAETGYHVSPLREISLRYHPDLPVIIVYFLCRLEEPQPIQEPSEPHEIAETCWVRIQELMALITTSLDPQVAKELKLV
ncbi:MAG TPA: NUDIX hydrolase [Patescibacteria group bacterium]|nr:NUDIX hydrolase [Patescibacteria group bacterium]